MKIGFIGYGSMAKALAPRFMDDGHEIFFGGRSKENARKAAGEIGIENFGTGAQSTGFGEVIVLATPHDAVFDAIDDAGGAAAFDEKIVIDINNPVPGYADGDYTLKTYEGRSLAEAIAEKVPGAQIAKAFNCCQAKVWQMDPPEFDGRRLVTMHASNGDRAREAADRLIRAVGSEPHHLGDLRYARQLESIASLVIKRLFEGADPLTAFNLVDVQT